MGAERGASSCGGLNVSPCRDPLLCVRAAQGDVGGTRGRLGGPGGKCEVRAVSPLVISPRAGFALMCAPLRRIVESTGACMFGLEESEVMERRHYMGFVRRGIDVRRDACYTLHREQTWLT